MDDEIEVELIEITDRVMPKSFIRRRLHHTDSGQPWVWYKGIKLALFHFTPYETILESYHALLEYGVPGELVE